MKAFTETTMTKEELLTELKWHQEQDNFIKGQYFREGKGCAVGCSLESLNRKKNLSIGVGDHSAYEIHLGIPEWVARLEDTIFEVSDDRSKTWPVEFIEAINVGSDLETIKKPFLIMVLKNSLKTFDHEKFPEIKNAVEGTIVFHQTVFESTESESAASSVAYLAASSVAYSVVYSAANSAANSAASSVAYSAANAATCAAYAASDAANSAAESVAYSAAESAAESAAYSAAYSAAWSTYADELLILMRECK